MAANRPLIPLHGLNAQHLGPTANTPQGLDYSFKRKAYAASCKFNRAKSSLSCHEFGLHRRPD
jgi:hypothetical protein